MRPTRSDLRSAYDAALLAVEPRAAVARSISLEGSVLVVGGHRFSDVALSDVVVVAIGKAAAAMAWGAHDIVGDGRGFVAATNVLDAPYPVCVGSHPVPEESSLRCGRALAAFVKDTKPTDVVVFLVSGGGSASVSLPALGVTIEDLAEMNSRLLASGLPIEDINEIRAAVSRIKGGKLAAATTAGRQVTLLLSDIVGAGPEHVASGPSIGFGLGDRAVSVLSSSGLRDEMPPAVVTAIDGFVACDAADPPLHTMVGSPSIAVLAAAADLRSRGFNTSVATIELMGEARSEAVALAMATGPGTVAVAGGETTVTIRGEGIGGRNQEAALSVAISCDGHDVLFAALGTDGIDGPTPACGAIVDGTTAHRAREAEIDLEVALGENDSHSVLTALGEAVVTGPSGTNVADLWIVAKGPFQSPQDVVD
jgi:glycerate-2-kinase